MLRAIREIQPSYVVGENVRGFTNWNGGMVFDQVQADLEAEGYEVLPFLLPACAVNAPHRRDRIWIIAHAKSSNAIGVRGGPSSQRENSQKIGQRFRDEFSGNGTARPTQNSHQDGRGSIERKEESKERGFRDVGTGDNERLRADNEDVGTTANAGLLGSPEHEKQATGIKQCDKGDDPDTGRIGQQGQGGAERPGNSETLRNWKASWSYDDGRWPTQPPVCGRTHGISSFLARNIKQEVYATISERYTDKDLQEVREAIQSEKVLREIGGLYKIHEPGILLEVLQLCSPSITEPQGVSVWSEKASEGLMRKVREYGTFANTPQGRELEKQFRKQFADSLPILSHEIALVAMEAERAAQKFASWHRKESIMAYGNAIVPQVAFEIFKTIDRTEQ